MLKQKYFLTNFFILSAEKQPIKSSWRNIEWLLRDQTFVDHTDDQFYLNSKHELYADSTEGAYDLKELYKTVNALPDEYRIPFAMYVSGFKYREIADKLDLPLGTVKSRIFFTRQKLQTELKDFR